MNDLIKQQDVIDKLNEIQKSIIKSSECYTSSSELVDVIDYIYHEICEVPTVEAKPVEWIPIEWHETTDDDEIDKERYPLYLDCAMPDDAQEIIICRKNGWVNVDTCIYDDGYSLDSGADWIEDVIAWMPLPAPYNADMRGGKNGRT